MPELAYHELHSRHRDTKSSTALCSLRDDSARLHVSSAMFRFELPRLGLSARLCLWWCLHTGELAEPSKRAVAKAVADQDQIVENAKNGVEDYPGGPPNR